MCNSDPANIFEVPGPQKAVISRILVPENSFIHDSGPQEDTNIHNKCMGSHRYIEIYVQT